MFKIMALSIAVGAALAVGAISWATKDPVPYNNVEVRRIEHVNTNTVVFVASFDKLDCDYQRMEVFAQYFGIWSDPLSWVDPTGEKGDRSEGGQTVNLRVNTGGRKYDVLEFRTRHNCNGEKTDKVFYRYVRS